MSSSLHPLPYSLETDLQSSLLSFWLNGRAVSPSDAPVPVLSTGLLAAGASLPFYVGDGNQTQFPHAGTSVQTQGPISPGRKMHFKQELGTLWLSTDNEPL